MNGAPSLDIRLLGELSVSRRGERVALPPSRKARALLAYLVLTGRTHRRDRLSSLLWDVADDPRGALRWSMSKLRGIVDDGAQRRIVADRETVLFDASGVTVDIFRLRDAVANLDATDTATLEECAELARGELLEGLDLYDFDEYQAWCIAERVDAHDLRVRLLRTLLDRHTEEPGRAIPYALQLTQAEPLDEPARVRLVELYAACGRVAEANQQLELARRTFAELGAEDSQALRELEARLRANARAASAPTSDSGASGRAKRPSAPVPRSPLARTTIHGLRLVGRRSEVEEVAEVLDSARDNSRSRLVLVYGEPGVGKSRLLVELMIETRKRGGKILEGCAYEAEGNRPYGPWIDALQRMDPTITSDPDSELGALLAPGAQRSDSSHEQLFRGVADFVARRATDAPLLLVAMDDLQWFDDASTELLHYVTRTVRDRPVVFVVTARGGELGDNTSALTAVRDMRRQSGLREIELGPLAQEEIGDLVRLVENQWAPELVFKESGGNPLFALEVARSSPGPDGSLAPSLGRIVRDRVDRLAPESGDLLRWAAVLGRLFRVDLLSKLVRLSAEEIAGALEDLERHSLIGGVVDLTSPGGTYQFSHYIVHRVVYGELSLPRKRLMHARVVAAYRDAGDDDKSAGELLHHAAEAGDFATAARAAVRGTRHCLRVFASGQAISMTKRGLACAAKLPEPEQSELTEELRSLLAEAEKAS